MGDATLDDDRRIVGLWLPAAAREGWNAINLFDAELARVSVEAKEPTLAAIRLAWWRERLEGLADGRSPPAQPLLQALATVRERVRLGALAQLDDAWLPLLEGPSPDWALHCRLRGGVLFDALAQLLGAAGRSEWTSAAGAQWAAGRVAHGELGVRAEGAVLDAVAPLGAPIPAAPDRRLRPLLALARLGARDLAAGMSGTQPERGATPGRQWVIARTMLGF